MRLKHTDDRGCQNSFTALPIASPFERENNTLEDRPEQEAPGVRLQASRTSIAGPRATSIAKLSARVKGEGEMS
jgi:hypothetical protein